MAPSLGLCRGCGLFRSDRAVDVPLHQPLDGSALNFFWSTGVGIASVSLIDAIGRELVFKSLRLGRVLDAAGKPLSDVRTFQAVTSVPIRGGATSKARRCGVCGTIIYAPVKAHHLVGDADWFKGPDQPGRRAGFGRQSGQPVPPLKPATREHREATVIDVFRAHG